MGEKKDSAPKRSMPAEDSAAKAGRRRSRGTVTSSNGHESYALSIVRLDSGATVGIDCSTGTD